MLVPYRQYQDFANSPPVLAAARESKSSSTSKGDKQAAAATTSSSSPSPPTSSSPTSPTHSSASSSTRIQDGETQNDRTASKHHKHQYRQESAADINRREGIDPDAEEPAVTVGGQGKARGHERTDGAGVAGHPDDEESAPNLTINKVSAPPKSDDPFLVSWDPDEPANPQNWPYWKKWALTGLVTMIGLVVGAAASIDSAAATYSAEKFGVSAEVMELQTAVFLVGFGLSAPLFGPLSELGGRVPVYVITLGLFSLFEVGSALAPNIQTRIICNFFAGFFGSSPLSNAGGSIADVVNARDRTYFFPAFAQAGFSGPVLGPVMGGYLGQNVGQEWCNWLMAIWGGATAIFLFFVMPETYSPVLLKMKASQMRKATGDDRYLSALERSRKDVSFTKHLSHALALPFLYLIYEPIVLLTSLYMTAIYIILFGDFEAYSIIFTDTFGFNSGETGLAFLPVAVGLFATMAFIPFLYKRYCRIERQVLEKKNAEVESARGKGEKFDASAAVAEGKWGEAAGLPEPEERLIIGMMGGILIPIAMFWQGWTTNASLSPWPCLCAGIFFGTGILCVFIASYQYIIDVYQSGSATALASLTFVRYIASGGSAAFTRPMYLSLGARWAQTLLALIALVFTPVPWIFFIYGQKIRKASRYAKG